MVFTLEIIEKGKGVGALSFHEIALNKYLLIKLLDPRFPRVLSG